LWHNEKKVNFLTQEQLKTLAVLGLLLALGWGIKWYRSSAVAARQAPAVVHQR